MKIIHLKIKKRYKPDNSSSEIRGVAKNLRPLKKWQNAKKNESETDRGRRMKGEKKERKRKRRKQTQTEI
jgi:hypothetical protein